MDEDSDEDDDDEPEILGKMEDIDDKEISTDKPEDAKFTGELAEGVDRIRVRILAPENLTSLVLMFTAQTTTFRRT